MKLRGSTGTTGIRLGIVTSRFNPEVTERLEAGALDYFWSKGFHDQDIVAVSVPGAFEIPFAVKALFEQGVDGVVALGAVIRGETSHFDYVCSAVERGCSKLQLKYRRPVSFGVLTTDTEEQALARAGGEHGNKGEEAAQVVLEMIDLIRQIKSLKGGNYE